MSCWQFIPNRRYFFAYILNGFIDVALQDKFNGVSWLRFRAGGGDAFYTVDGIDGTFNPVGDVHVHNIGAGALECRCNGDNGKSIFGEHYQLQWKDS
jgi:hypothetical protein